MKALGGGLSGAAGTFNYHSDCYLINIRSLAMVIQVLTLMVSPDLFLGSRVQTP